MNNQHPIVILTALDLEYAAIREQLTDPQTHRHRAGTRWEVGYLKDSSCRVALGLVGKGNQPAAALAERAIAEFNPAALLFVGVAGALRTDVDLGDVVVATHVYAYHGGTSQDDGLKARPRVWEAAHGADQIARHLDRTRSWTRRLPAGHSAQRVHFGPIAAGEVVQDSAISEQARWIKSIYNDAIAIEMEAAGIAQAAHLNLALPVVIVRGISDRADGSKTTTDRSGWQQKAVQHAAAFATALAEELHGELSESTTPPGSADSTEGSTAMTNSNIARDNARVGIQAGQIHGDVHFGFSPPSARSLSSGLDELREDLIKARANGNIDESTFDAAQQEVAAATAALPDRTPAGRNRLLLALKRLRGLLFDVTELAAKVAALIAVLRGSS